MDLTNIRTVKELMEKYGLRFQKKYGQNFLINPRLPERIAIESGIDENTGVIEIGPGIGTLTKELCKRAGKVICFEIDNGLMPVLGETLAEFDNVKVIFEDIMKTDLKKVIEEEFSGKTVYVCANLPYYITTPILMMLLESGIRFEKLTFMVQKEVADRLCSSNERGDYGAVTLSVNYYGKIEKLFNVSPGNFMPPPKVDSAVIQIEPYKDNPFTVNDEKLLFRVISAAFEMRRKTLVNALNGKFGLGKPELANIISELFGNADVRGEKLSINDFVILSNSIYEKYKKI